MNPVQVMYRRDQHQKVTSVYFICGLDWFEMILNAWFSFFIIIYAWFQFQALSCNFSSYCWLYLHSVTISFWLDHFPYFIWFQAVSICSFSFQFWAAIHSVAFFLFQLYIYFVAISNASFCLYFLLSIRCFVMVSFIDLWVYCLFHALWLNYCLHFCWNVALFKYYNLSMRISLKCFFFHIVSEPFCLKAAMLCLHAFLLEFFG